MRFLVQGLYVSLALQRPYVSILIYSLFLLTLLL